MKGIPPYFLPATLSATALLLFLDPVRFRSPVVPAVTVPGSATSTDPVRHPSLKPIYRSGAFDYKCSDCHAIIPSPAETQRPLTQHREIRLRHGINTRCFNCHHRANRDALVDDFGQEIPWGSPQLLCAKCHGTVYRDWQAGSHGRINGYWDTGEGPQTKLRCIECHDPHDPPFAPMQPAPGPHTLRMGPPTEPVHHGKRDPLRVHSGHPEPEANH